MFGPAFFQDPYSVLATMREHTPAQRVISLDGYHSWLVTRHDDVRSVLTHPAVSKDSRATELVMARNAVSAGSVRQFTDNRLARQMLGSDPPEHTRLRRLVSTAFTPGRIDRLRPRIEQITAELLDPLVPGQRVDLIDDFAFLLSLTVIGELLGVVEEDREPFRRWSTVMVSNAAPEERGRNTLAMLDYLGRLVADKRANPADDMLSALVEATDDEQHLSEEELIATAFLLLIAGHESTANLIGSGMLALLDHPDQFAALRADLSLLPGAIEEFLRYEGPANITTFRFTTAAVCLGEVTIPPDQLVMVSLGSADRDPTRFPDADRFDIHRPIGGHLAFGHGVHYCLGAPLARIEADVAFRALLGRFPDMRLAVPRDELRWRESVLVRGLEALPVLL